MMTSVPNVSRDTLHITASKRNPKGCGTTPWNMLPGASDAGLRARDLPTAQRVLVLPAAA